LNELQPCVEPLPKGSRLGGSVQGEREFLLQYVRPQYENKSAKEALGLLRKDEVSSDEEAKAILKSVGGDVKELLKLIDGAAAFYDNLAKISVLANSEYQKAFSALRNKHVENNAYAAALIPVVEPMRGAADRVEVRFAMLR